MFQKSTGLPVLAFPHVHLTVEDVMRGEVDELEEDLG